MVKRAGARALVLTPMLEQIAQPGMREKIVPEIAEIYKGIIIWGEDLMTLEITRSGR